MWGKFRNYCGATSSSQKKRKEEEKKERKGKNKKKEKKTVEGKKGEEEIYTGWKPLVSLFEQLDDPTVPMTERWGRKEEEDGRKEQEEERERKNMTKAKELKLCIERDWEPDLVWEHPKNDLGKLGFPL